jgi:hypothetical protein
LVDFSIQSGLLTATTAEFCSQRNSAIQSLSKTERLENAFPNLK